jgi:hypothetical protein
VIPSFFNSFEELTASFGRSMGGLACSAAECASRQLASVWIPRSCRHTAESRSGLSLDPTATICPKQKPLLFLFYQIYPRCILSYNNV